MKKTRATCAMIFSICFLSLLLLGCAKESSAFDADDYGTLRFQAEERFKNVKWTDSLEKDRLTQDISFVDSIAKTIRLTPAIFLSGELSKTVEPVYPFLEGFSSLDVSKVPDDIMEITVKFAENLCTGTDSDSLMDKKSVYELALFYNDLKSEWKTVFLQDYPVPKEKEKPEDENTQTVGAPSSEKIDSQDEDSTNATVAEKLAEKYVFDSYVIGEGFELNALYEIPVRFKREEEKYYADILIYFYKQKDEWKINQLKILRMEAKQ
mgnify:CR=1 FL=1